MPIKPLSRGVTPPSPGFTTPTSAPVATPTPTPLAERRRLGTSPFSNAAKEVLAARAEKAKDVRAQIGRLPSGILSAPADVAKFRALTKELAGLQPVVAGGQRYDDQVFRITRTDFAQTEVKGLAPAGDVIQVLADGNTRANFSTFKTPDGRALNAVEIGRVSPNASGARIDITGLYGFEAVSPPLTPRESLDLTRGIKKALDLADGLRQAKGLPPQAGARSPQEVNQFMGVLASNDRQALSALLPPNVSPEKRADLESLASRFTDAERAVLKRVGRVIDLSTLVGPVAGTIPGVGVGFQQFLSNQGNQPGDRVVFQSGSLFSLEGLPVGTSAQKPGDRGYQYTFEAERLKLD
jgi:hypothetical protein